MSDEVAKINPVTASKLREQQAEALRAAGRIAARQESIEATLEENADYANFGYLYRSRNFQTLEERFLPEPTAGEELKKASEVIKTLQEVEDVARRFAEKNPELNAKALMVLRSLVSEKDSMDDILEKVRNTYPDQYLTDEALDFLIQTTKSGTKHHDLLLRTKEQFNREHAREIKAGKNIAEEARIFSKEGLGSPTGLRDLYRHIIGNPREPLQLFNELMKVFNFAKLKQAIDFVLHSIGADMKSKGPSISLAELQNLFSSARVMQSILGVFVYFQSRMNLIQGAFQRNALELPSKLTFQILAEQFMKLIAERYPSTDKILRMAALLGIAEEYMAQIIIFTQYRDAMRQVSPRLFKSDKHRQDFLKTFLDTLSELEDLLDDENEEDEDQPRQRPQQDTME